MTKAEYRKKVRGLANDVKKAIIAKADSIAISGCLDLEEQPDNYVTPKNVVQAIIEQTYTFYPPHTRADRKIIDNIKHF